MRNLNKKQQKWVLDNTPIGKVLVSSLGYSTTKIIGYEHGYVIVETTYTLKAIEDNYNMGLITKEQFLSGESKITTKVNKILYTSPIWHTYFPELLSIKSK
jgi:hypothetical protein